MVDRKIRGSMTARCGLKNGPNILLVITCVFISFGCYWLGRGTKDVFPEYEWVEVSKTPEWQDSLEVQLLINDTVFELSDIDKFIRLEHDSLYDSIIGELHRPICRFSLVNNSSTPFLVYYCDRTYVFSQLYWSLMIFDFHLFMSIDMLECEKSDVYFIDALVTDFEYSAHMIPPHQSLQFDDSIDVFLLYGEYYELCERPTQGEYWVQLRYNNRRWKDTIPFVWTGTVYSDTIWFRLVK